MKLRLNPEELRVQAFATTGGGARNRGTVRAHEQSAPYVCASGAWSCLPDQTCEDTCALSCAGTCHPALQTCAASCPCGES